MAKVRWKRVGIFYATALVLAALAALPLWLDPRGLATSYSRIVLLGVMFTPALAAWLTISRPAQDSVAGLQRFGLRKPRSVTSNMAFAVLLPLIFGLGALAVGALFRQYAFDSDLSGFKQQLKTAATPAATQAALVIASIVPASFVNAVPALGEELAWRGALFEELRPLPAWRADVLTGVLWGLWHAPITLLGYNYPSAPILGALVLMPGMCIPLAVCLGWLRRRSGSVLIAALAHGAFNAAATLSLLFFEAGSPPNSVHATLTGWTGWILPAIFGLWLALTDRLTASETISCETDERAQLHHVTAEE